MSLLAMPIRGGLHRPLRRLCRASPRRCIASMSMDGQIHLLSSPLETADPIMFDIIERENKRQKASINLIPSENFTSRGVLDALGSIMQNKYSEGYPGKRYYGGNSVIDEAETLCQHRALETFGLSPAEWGVNVQALSGSPANLYVYSALLKPHDRLMGLDLPHGGHLSHGYQTTTKKISAVSKYFETLPYRLDEQTGYINYDKLEEMAMLYRPKLIVAGATAYSRLIDYKRMRDICDKVNAYMMADIAHLAGMIAAKAIPGPFSFADVVTTTTHKSLRGPRGALIFYRRGDRTGTNARATNSAKLQDSELPAIEPLINASVFPGHQGGPHNHTIAAIAVALRQAQSTDFISYQNQVLANARALARRLGEPRDKGGLGYAIVGGGTDNHMVLIDLKPNGVDGARVERILELVGVAANKNTVPGDRSALVPGGLRIGTPAMTTRGFSEDDFVRVAGLIDRAVVIAGRVDKAARKGADERGATPATAGRIRTFLDYLGDGDSDSEIVQLRSEVAAWVSTYPLPSDAHL